MPGAPNPGRVETLPIRVSAGRLIGAYVLVVLAMLLAGLAPLVFGWLYSWAGVMAALVAIFIAAAACVLVAETRRALLYGFGACGAAFVMLLLGSLLTEFGYVLGSSLVGAAWALARFRDRNTVALVTILVAIVGGIILAADFVRNVHVGYSNLGPVVCVGAAVAVAWISAALSPRSRREFAPVHEAAGTQAARVVVGHTEDGRPVYAAGYVGGPSPGPNGLAIGSFVCSLTALSIVAIILGHMSVSRSKQDGQPTSGLATAGLILGYLTLLAQIVFVGLMVAAFNGVTPFT